MHTPLHARQRGPLNWALLLLATLLLNGGALRAQTADTYNFAATTGTYTALTGGTTVSNIQTDDALSATIQLGFPFVFDGNTYTSCKVSSNGWLTFNTAATANSLSNNLDTGTASERPRVAPYWDDLTGSSGTASYLTSGTAPNRVFTFEWRNWARLSTSGAFSMQVQLVEGTNAVRFVYRQESNLGTGVTASIGLSGAASSSFLSLSNTSTSPTASSASETDNISTFPATGQIYTFTPPIITACPTPRNLNSAVLTNSAFVTFTVTNTTNSGPFTILYGPAGFDPMAPSTGTNSYQTVTTTTNSIILTGLTALTTYQYYVVQNCGGSTGNSSMSSVGTFTTNPNPATNDNCAQAVALPVAATCTTPTNGTVYGATQNIAPTTGCTSSTTANDVWYSFVANGTNQTITFSPLFAGIVDVRSGNCTTSTSVFCTSAAAGASVSSNVGGLTNGQTYYVRVYASGSTAPVVSSSTFTLCVTTGPVPPANDECTNAVPLSVGTTCSAPVIGTVVGAAQSLPPTPGCTATNAFDVWYSFTATGPTQTITFAPQFAAILNVRSGACANSTSVFCAATAAAGTTNNNLTGLTAGQTYYVRVYPSTAVAPSPSSATFILCASGRPTASRAQADTEALLVFPNPSNTGQLTLRLAGAAGAGQATLLNALGQTVLRQQLSGAAEQTLSTRALAAGLYTLRVTVGDQVLTRKVVLE